MATKTKLRGRGAIILHVDGGDDFGVDKVTPLPYTFGVVSRQSRDGTMVREIVDASGERYAATAHTHLLPSSIYPCGLLAAVRTGELDGKGVASVSDLRAIVRKIIHTASHRAMCARHDLGDGCECDLAGWR